MKTHQYFVYILCNANRTLYVGMTNNLERRVHEHKSKLVPGFTARYDVTCLVYFEIFSDVRDAIAREKQLKAGSRSKKIALIEKDNPHWNDLARQWA